MATTAYLRISMALIKRTWLLALMLSISGPAFAFSQGIFVKKLRVQQESQLDWQYAVRHVVFQETASERMGEYKSRKQLYDLFGPRLAPSRELPLILFISPGNVPLHLHQVLRDHAADVTDKKRAMERLGFRSYHGTLLSQAEIERLQQQEKIEKERFEKWSPQVQKWRLAFASKQVRWRKYALEKLREVTDASAVPTLERLLSHHSEPLALEVVTVLGNIPDHESTTSLVRHSIDSPWVSVRDTAAEELAKRPLHDFIPQVLGELETPIQSRFYVTVGSDGLVRHKHELFREGAQENHLVPARMI